MRMERFLAVLVLAALAQRASADCRLELELLSADVIPPPAGIQKCLSSLVPASAGTTV